MFTVDDARSLATLWRDRFVDETAFEESWTRYFATAIVPDAARLEAWLAKDLAKDEVRNAGIVKEPTTPQLSRYERNDCYHCAGNRYVRVNVPISDPRFGKALCCPDCNGGSRSEVLGPPDDETKRTGNWCWKCGAGEFEPAREGCTNPPWHVTSDRAQATFDDVVKRF